MTTTTNPYQFRYDGDGDYEIFDSRNGRVLDIVRGKDAAVLRCSELLRNEANRALALVASVAEPSPAELAEAMAAVNVFGEALPADDAEALARQLYGEWVELVAMGADRWGDACQVKNGRIQALGFALVRRDGVWSLRRNRDGAIIARLAATAVAGTDQNAGSPAEGTALTAEAAALDAILFRRVEVTEAALRLAAEAGDRDGEKIARNSIGAYTKARALLAQAGVEFPGRAYLPTASGDLLVRSSSRAGAWHSVRRRPVGGDGYTPIVCSCEHGQRGGFGICVHVGLFEAYEELCDAEVELTARALLAA